MIFTTFETVVIIQTVQLQNAQTSYKMREKDRVNILIHFFFYVSFKNTEISRVKNLFFQVGVEIHPHLVLKWLRMNKVP